MDNGPLPVINPPYSRTAVGAHVVGVLDHPTEQLLRITQELLDDGVHLSEISVFGRRDALNAFDVDIDPACRPQASRIVHLFDVNDRELRHYQRAIESSKAVMSVRVNTFERQRMAHLMKSNGVRDVAFYSRRHHRLPADDLGISGNAALPKRRY